MDRAEAKRSWIKAFAADSPEERYPHLNRLATASPKDVISLASAGRRRFDREADDREARSAYLFAKSRQENSLFDVVDINVDRTRKRPQIWSITTYSEMSLKRIPGRFFVNCRVTGRSGLSVGGSLRFIGCPGSGQFIPELERAIPSPRTYVASGFTFRCYWTLAEVLEDYNDWLVQIQSPDPAIWRAALARPTSFHLAEFSDEACAAIRPLVAQRLLDALGDPDRAVWRGAYAAIDKFEVVGEAAVAVAARLLDSTDAERRKAGLSYAISTTKEQEVMLVALLKGLGDPDREVRWEATSFLRSRGRLLQVAAFGQVFRKVGSQMEVEEDPLILQFLSEWYVRCHSKNAASVRELCRLAQLARPAAVRAIAITRLGQIGANHPVAARTVVKCFEEFPLQAADALIALKVYSRPAKAAMCRLVKDADWSKRWRAVQYIENCPAVSPAMAKSVSNLLDDKEFTVRDAALRVVRKLKRKGVL